MRRSPALFSILCASALISLFSGGAAAKAPAADANQTFGQLVKQYLGEAVMRDPLFADSIGVHTQDNRLPDLSSTGRAERHRWQQAWRTRFGAIDETQLTQDNRVDLAQMLDLIGAELFEDDTLRPAQTDPLLYVGIIGDAGYQLTSRPYAPLDVRLRHVALRMSLIPAVVRAAEANLKNPPRVFTKLAADQNKGVIDFYRHDVVTLAKTAAPRERAVIMAASPGLVSSLRDFQAFLEGPLLKRSNGNPRVGATVFDRELLLVDGLDMPRAALVERARANFAAARVQMLRLALPLDRRFFPGRMHRERGEALINVVVGEVLDRLSAQHPTADTMFDVAKADVAGLEAFLRANPVVPLPQPDTLHVLPTPPFKAGIAGASLDPPGPFTPLAGSFYYITPIPKDWPAWRVESYLREENNFEMKILSTHEAVPGHYVQFRYNAQVPSLVRRVWPNGSYAEGWAIYTEAMMLDAGYGGGDPGLRLFQLKWRLREYTNTIIDAAYHTGNLTKTQCIDLLTKGAFQERAQAEEKWHRLELSHDQLTTYFGGLVAIEQARASERARLGEKFSIQDFNRRLLHLGSVEPRFISVLIRHEK